MAYMMPPKAGATIAEQLGLCENVVRFAGVIIGCDKPAGHEGSHGGVYPSDDADVDVAVSW